MKPQRNYQIVAALPPEVEVGMRKGIENRLKKKLPSDSHVGKGDTDLQHYKRIFIFTDRPLDARRILMGLLQERHIETSRCRVHCRNLRKTPTVLTTGARNRGADVEETFDITHAFDRAGNAFAEVMRKYPPQKWQEEAQRRLSQISIRRDLLHAGYAAGMNMPPADDDGMVNMLEFTRHNPSLFPNLLLISRGDPEWLRKQA